MFQYSHIYDLIQKTCIPKNDIKKGNQYEELKVIASWCICNTASLNVFKFEDDRVLVAINDNKPEWYEIENCRDEDWEDKNLEDEWNLGINFNGSVYFLDECMKV